MSKTWLVVCPDWQNEDHINKAQGWGLFTNQINAVKTNYFDHNISCITCGRQFSLKDGFRAVFASDMEIDSFRHNSSEHGMTDITVGILSTIKFSQPFVDIPVVNLTPFGSSVNVVSGNITSREFAIYSSEYLSQVGKIHKISWFASGNREQTTLPLWRTLISNAKEHQKSKNYRSEIVELESAFEVFISEYLGLALGKKLRQETRDWILNRSIEELVNIGFREVNGMPLAKLHQSEYSNWFKSVKETRDHIVHRGINVTAEQASDARKAIIDLMVKVDPTILLSFQIEMTDIGVNTPHMTFGIATGTGSQQAIKHGLGAEP